MPLSNILKFAAGTCQYCGNKAGLIARDRPDCRRTHDAGWPKMVESAADTASTHQLDEKTLHLTVARIAGRSYRDDTTVDQSLEENGKQGRKPLPDYRWG